MKPTCLRQPRAMGRCIVASLLLVLLGLCLGGQSIGIDGAGGGSGISIDTDQEPGDGDAPDLSLEQSLIDAVDLVNARRDDVLYPVNINNWWGLMNRRGQLVVYPRFDWADYAWEGLSRAVKDGHTGFINGRGEWRIDPVYAYADRYADGYAVVGDGTHFGYLDKTGDIFVPIRLDAALRFREGLAAVQQGDRIGFIDRRAKLVIPRHFVRARSFHDGLAVVRFAPDHREHPDVLGYINKTGRLMFQNRDRRFNDLGDFHDGLAPARAGEKWGYIDRRFQLHIQPRFDEAEEFVDGIARVKLDGKWGYIDKRGQTVVEAVYLDATDFAQGRGVVQTEAGFGYVDRTGALRIEPQFDWAKPFFRDLARVEQPPNFGYVDKAAHIIWDPRAPLRAIRNRKSTEDVWIESQNVPRGHRLIPAPIWREPVERPYPPDHLYEPELPREKSE